MNRTHERLLKEDGPPSVVQIVNASSTELLELQDNKLGISSLNLRNEKERFKELNENSQLEEWEESHSGKLSGDARAFDTARCASALRQCPSHFLFQSDSSELMTDSSRAELLANESRIGLQELECSLSNNDYESGQIIVGDTNSLCYNFEEEIPGKDSSSFLMKNPFQENDFSAAYNDSFAEKRAYCN
ncbi:uncharacterized protein MONOS_1350 [Monocercomonoides exilis]|uniref:uncharacterized protein n=1 Tax=Monocercomonoides exilis TaxID=2049356 RepID=UPI003559D833|nr:hypothetical protein MONOS_1350 [Monocercomonoides exilis]|eukprot:MONOS_1350.1-p1 / transcript=MONOS_1350.1 / gene=MONOS_1350 / organism=Monocercomonoides_exilis_PA203 / gene_product=unspecified product / transcript_product=unspecified product / location=Mono_scaffold00023:124128-124694(-) / protein_length=189 / sequence_SO=supercontig / SO=protein_coding / is_pseudo=false